MSEATMKTTTKRTRGNMKIKSEWGRYPSIKWMFRSVWKWNCFVPLHLILYHRRFVPFGWNCTSREYIEHPTTYSVIEIFNFQLQFNFKEKQNDSRK